jgi:acyl dehydratase
MDALFYEDFRVGAESTTTARTTGESDPLRFAALTGDWNRLHTDAECSKGTPCGQRITHGLPGLALMEGMKCRLGQFDGTAIASLSWNDVRFAKPVFIGDTVRVHVRITVMRETSKPDRGIVTGQVHLLNQRDEVATEAEHLVTMRRRGH